MRSSESSSFRRLASKSGARASGELPWLETPKAHRSRWRAKVITLLLRWKMQPRRSRIGQTVALVLVSFVLKEIMQSPTPKLVKQSKQQAARGPLAVLWPENGKTELLNLSSIPLDHDAFFLDEPIHDEEASADAAHYQKTFEKGDCVALYEWQKGMHPTCNIVHETDITNMRHKDKSSETPVEFVSYGTYRCVWKIEEWDNSNLALKTLLYSSSFTYKEMENHRRDAAVMELLTPSKHIPDIYSYCAMAGVTSFSSDGDLKSHLFPYDGEENTWTKEDRLVVSWQVAKALADLHGMGNGDIIPIVHTDLDYEQYLYMDGIFKLNDFNRARFVTRDKNTGKTCQVYVDYNPNKFRSPEEYRYDYLTPKTDVYQMGNVIYSLLTKLQLYPTLSSEKVWKFVADGGRPFFSDDILNSTDPLDMAMLHAIQMTSHFEPDERSSAKEVADYLEGELERLHISKL